MFPYGNWSPATGTSAQAAPCDTGARVRTGGEHAYHSGRCSCRCRDQPRPVADDAKRCIPKGHVLSAEYFLVYYARAARMNSVNSGDCKVIVRIVRCTYGNIQRTYS